MPSIYDTVKRLLTPEESAHCANYGYDEVEDGIIFHFYVGEEKFDVHACMLQPKVVVNTEQLDKLRQAAKIRHQTWTGTYTKPFSRGERGNGLN